MALDPLTAILNLGNNLIDKFFTDKNQAATAKAQLLDMQVQGELDAIKGQLTVDAVEAASQSKFVAGWRPFVGWCCGAALAYSYIVQPCIVSICVLSHVTFDATKLPVLNMTELLGLLTTMLGMGVMRSIDKVTGTDNGH